MKANAKKLPCKHFPSPTNLWSLTSIARGMYLYQNTVLPGT